MKYATTYKEVLKWRGGILRRTAREIALNLLAFKKTPDKNIKGIQFLYFHYLYNDEQENAEKIIGWIAKNFNVISYTEATNRILYNNIDDYYICFSSDDGFKNNLEAAKIFNKYNISCCFFINPESIENREIEFQSNFCKNRLEIPLTNFLTWEDVELLITEGHEIGNHSYGHEIQSNLTADGFYDDLNKSHKILTSRLGEIKHYAYPRGLFKYFNKEYLEYLYEFGYTSCATAERGLHIPQPINTNIENIALRRDVIVFKEPISFIKYFLKKAQINKSPQNTFWQKG